MAVTIKDLARMTGFSTSTVSRVLSRRGYTDEQTRKIVEEAVRESGYVYKPVANRRNSIDIVMLIMEQVSNETYTQESTGISSVFDAMDIMHVGAYGERYHSEKLEAYMKRAIKSHFKGMILFSPIETPSFQRIMQNCSIPCVALNRPIDSLEMDTVCMDNKAAGRMAVEYLISRGHRRIVHLAVTVNSSGRHRMRGYLDAMEQAGLPVEENDVVQVDDSYEAGVNAGYLIAVAKTDVTAVYATNELIARGMIEGLRKCGKRVPEDISIISTDNTTMSIISPPHLTTVCCNTYQMGAEAAQLFIERCQNPLGQKKQLFLPPELVERDSVMDIRSHCE